MENKNLNNYEKFEEVNFNSKIVESRTFEKETKENEEINNNPKNFNEIHLQNINKCYPHISVEDKGFNYENYRNYEISYIDDKNTKKIKCYRRFSNFDMLNLKLREKFPFVIIPSLPKKNYAVKIINLTGEFYLNRGRELNFYLNYIFNHEILKNSNEFLKFLNDADFVRIKLIY